MARTDHPRGCSCEMHTRQREYARELRARKARGEVVERHKLGSTPTTRNIPKPKAENSRLMESTSGDGMVVHWMPKDEPEWQCPKCNRWFLKVDGKWTEPWVA